MNKSALFFISIIFICVGVFSISCIADDDDDDKITEPTVYLNTNGNAYDISFSPIENMRYANIFRQRSSNKFATIDETVNIGQVIPADTASLPNSFVFEDAYVNNTNGTGTYSYRYFIRFWDNATYSYTKVSAAVTYLEDAKAEAVLEPTDDISVLYVRNDYEAEKNFTLYLQTPITIPTGFEELHVIIGMDKSITKKPFLFASREDTTEVYTFPGDASDVLQSTAIDFHKVLPAAFFDTTLCAYGFIGVVKIGYKGDTTQISNGNYTNYYWTKISPLEGSENEEPGQIHYSYRDEAGDWEPDEPTRASDNTIAQYPSTTRDNFIVPSIKDPENEFDYSNPYLNRTAPSDSTRTLLEITDEGVTLDFSPYRP